MQVKKQQSELDLEQQTGSKSGKEYIKAVYIWECIFTVNLCEGVSEDLKLFKGRYSRIKY